jgi:hypothetical protein
MAANLAGGVRAGRGAGTLQTDHAPHAAHRLSRNAAVCAAAVCAAAVCAAAVCAAAARGCAREGRARGVRLVFSVLEGLCAVVGLAGYLVMAHASSTALQLVGAFVASVAGLCWLMLIAVGLAVRLYRWWASD